MILGVYWYYEFPSGLYSFDYFVFRKGVRGHGDGYAQLETSIVTNDAAKIVDQLSALVIKHKQASLFVKRDNNLLTISINSSNFFDYDFLVAKEIETLLFNAQVQFNSNQKLSNPELLRLENVLPELDYPSKSLFQIVSSPLGQYSAEALSIRLDCNLSVVNQQKFIEDLDDLTGKLNIDIFYYYESVFSDKNDLMLFFSNGRQGINLQEKKVVNVRFFEEHVEALFQKFSVAKGHLGGMKSYPKGEPKVRKSLHW